MTAVTPMPSSSDLLVLHGLKLKGFAEAHAVAAVTGLSESEVATRLAAAADAGLVLRRETRAISGWMLTPTGKNEHRTLIVGEVEASGVRPTVRAAYEAFLPLNATLLRVCTDWQVVDIEANELNHHDDPDYDAAVIARLGEVHQGVIPICAALGGALRRYEPYPGRFETALGRVRSGLNEWFTKPIIDSYHTVWMELHEDLLATLSIDRASEGH
jgi:hypothetical protein